MEGLLLWSGEGALGPSSVLFPFLFPFHGAQEAFPMPHPIPFFHDLLTQVSQAGRFRLADSTHRPEPWDTSSHS